jgi:hypothetical protein
MLSARGISHLPPACAACAHLPRACAPLRARRDALLRLSSCCSAAREHGATDHLCARGLSLPRRCDCVWRAKPHNCTQTSRPRRACCSAAGGRAAGLQGGRAAAEDGAAAPRVLTDVGRLVFLARSVDDQEDEMEEEDELQEDDAGEDAGMMESEIIEDVSGGMTAEGRKRQKRQTMPYMTKYERARILGYVTAPLSHRIAAVAPSARAAPPPGAAKVACANHLIIIGFRL